MTTKAQLRREIAEKRNLLKPRQVTAASLLIVDQIQSLGVFQTAKSVALYKAIGGEVDLDPLFPLCWKDGKSTCIPVFNAEMRLYELASVTADTAFKTGNYGIREPVDPSLVPLRDIDLVLVPGVAFDPAGNRLGRGGGYYDRLLNGFEGTTVAVAFDFQVFPEIPCDAHDIPVQYVVTDTESIKVQNER